MPSFNFVKKTHINSSFKNQAIIDRYDISTKEVREQFIGNIDLDCDWNIGVIVGSSGTGKSSIIKELFDYKDEHIDHNKTPIELFDTDLSTSEELLRNVGFSSPMSWIKPFGVLSNGEKMRVELAYKLSLNKDVVIFDEFTSVVDRQIAKIGSVAVSKTIKKYNKKFIAVTCHYDVLEWLQPDWVFDTNNYEYKITRGLLRRPILEFKIHKIKGLWSLFSKYHYLDHKLNNAADQFAMVYNDIPVAFCAVLHFPHPKVRNMKKISRIVVNPEWQGIGLGTKFINFIGSYYAENKYRVAITTSNPGLIKYFDTSNKWVIKSYGYLKKDSNTTLLKMTKRAGIKACTAEWSNKKCE